MESKKDIGKAFRDKLDRLDKTAPGSGWTAISGELQQMKMQRRFPWKRVLGSLLLLLLIGLVATYPLWEDDVPHVYIEMPEEHEGQGDDIKEKGMHEKSTAEEAQKTGTNSVQDKINEGTGTGLTIIPKGNDPRNSIQTDSPISTIRPTGIGNENYDGNTIIPLPKAAAEMPIPDKTSTGTKFATAGTDDGEGKYKMLDLSSVNYGTDTLKFNKNKKLDTKRISDSLNKLYGKERAGRKNKEKE
ncbi:hypothetical protein [Flavobacterium sp.]|uniref:hypothetical protein n=1 Tax=Flavobacterium sp. TaxID=239 RepID=UPI004033BF47